MDRFPLTRHTVPLMPEVEVDDVTVAALKPFDLAPDAPMAFYPFRKPEHLPASCGIGLIVGASGSGKSKLLAEFGQQEQPEWQANRSIASHFGDAETAADRFYAVGLNSVPVWRLPYNVLSNGQRFRADLARVIGDGAIVDEFTSVVDRNVAVSASRALRSWVDRTGARGLVLASCHRDVIRWLRPDWVVDTDAGMVTVGQVDDPPKWHMQFVTGPEVGRLVVG